MINIKHITLLFVTFVGGINLSGQEAIQYHTGSWQEITATARKEHKYIFIDCYTDWCGWCKVMDKRTMTDSTVTRELNDSFIPVKMDMEKGEGITMAMKFHLIGFPSFLYFSPDGRYVYQSAGYQSVKDFLTNLRDARDKSKQVNAPGYSNSLNVAYPDFYRKAFGEGGKKQNPSAGEVFSYLDQQKDLTSEVCWAIMSRFDMDAKRENYFVQHFETYKRLYGRFSVNDKMNAILGARLQKAIQARDKELLTQVIDLCKKYLSQDFPLSADYCRVAYYGGVQDWNAMADAIDNFVKKDKYNTSAYISTQAMQIANNNTDKKLLKRSCGWLRSVADKDPSYPNLLNYANILYKAGEHDEALKVATRALSVGRENGEDVAGTEMLLKKIRGN